MKTRRHFLKTTTGNHFPNDGQWHYLVVTQNAAHSWVEAWFPGFGWVTFDPTPAGSGEAVVRNRRVRK